MPAEPPRKFKIGDAVINTEFNLMGIVTGFKWEPSVRSHIYDYRCEYKTDQLEIVRQVI